MTMTVAALDEGEIVPVPTPDSYHDKLTKPLPPDAFCSGDRVWVRRGASWRPGIILHSSAEAATVRYRPVEGRGTGVDTVIAGSLAPRDDPDPVLDQAVGLERSRGGDQSKAGGRGANPARPAVRGVDQARPAGRGMDQSWPAGRAVDPAERRAS